MKTPWWFLHKTLLAFLLLPVSWVYYFFSVIVYNLRKISAYKSRRKIICFGNILAGGVGKTPIVRAVAKYLDAPVVMRGYKKGKKTGWVGDEAMMLARDKIQVHVGDRKSNVILLNKQKDNTPIIMDDGLQNPRIKKDLSVLVFDQGLGFGNGFLLPAGPLREPRWAIRRANAVIIIRGAKKVRKIKLPPEIPVFYADSVTISPYDENEKIFAFAGIGYPRKFFGQLKNVVGKKTFPDHYQYTDDDLRNLIATAEQYDARLLTTEKDWVRLPQWARTEIKYARLDITLGQDFFDWLGENI